MKTVAKILKFEFNDVFRSKWIIFYSLFFLVITDLLFRFGGEGSKVIISLMNLVFIFIPLVSIIFGTIYLYNSREFVELLLSQPINRGSLFWGMYVGLTLPLISGFLLGVGMAFGIHGLAGESAISALIYLLTTGVFLILIFVGLAFLISVSNEDKARGLGISIILWLFFAVIYDAFILFFIFFFSDYPMEKTVIFLTLLNPVDLARTLLLLKMDISALMGYTGASFQKFFGSQMGAIISFAALLFWTLIPLGLGVRKFKRKDF